MKTLSKIISAAAVAAVLPLSAFAYTSTNDAGPLVSAQTFEAALPADAIASLTPISAVDATRSGPRVTAQNFASIQTNVATNDTADQAWISGNR